MEMIDHGNIFRSAMAEYIFKDMINKKDLQAFHGFYEFITFHQKSSIYKKLVSKLVSNNLNLIFDE